jgi:hypothetical protein
LNIPNFLGSLANMPRMLFRPLPTLHTVIGAVMCGAVRCCEYVGVTPRLSKVRDVRGGEWWQDRKGVDGMKRERRNISIEGIERWIHIEMGGEKRRILRRGIVLDSFATAHAATHMGDVSARAASTPPTTRR